MYGLCSLVPRPTSQVFSLAKKKTKMGGGAWGQGYGLGTHPYTEGLEFEGRCILKLTSSSLWPGICRQTLWRMLPTRDCTGRSHSPTASSNSIRKTSETLQESGCNLGSRYSPGVSTPRGLTLISHTKVLPVAGTSNRLLLRHPWPASRLKGISPATPISGAAVVAHAQRCTAAGNFKLL